MSFFSNKQKNLVLIIVFYLFYFFAFAQNYVGDSDAVFYRGKREPRDFGSFSVLNISTMRIDSKNVRFDILFNQAIDPKSVESAVFLIDDNKSVTKEKIEFSKDGKKIRVVLEVKASSFNFEVQNIQSYNGKILNKIKSELKDNGEVRISSEELE